MEQSSVIIVGAGPVGLMSACELALHGVDVTVLERRTDIDPTIKAGSINVPTIEVHSPFGGQGLNLGIGDAMNLGWKLAAVIAGTAPDSLLNSYTAERHPIGAQVLQWSRAQVALMRLDAGTNALRDIVAELMQTRAGATFFAKRVAGVRQRYDLAGKHAMVGRSCPDLELHDDITVGSTPTVNDHLHAGNGLLLDLTGDAAVRASAQCADIPAGLQMLTARCPSRPDLAAVLVRPDGYVAWAAGREPDGSVHTDGLTEALGTWFGAGLGAGAAVSVRN